MDHYDMTLIICNLFVLIFFNWLKLLVHDLTVQVFLVSFWFKIKIKTIIPVYIMHPV